MLVGTFYWGANLPWALEAFFCSRPCSARVRRMHADFLGYYGLTRAEVPLLHYRCSQNDVTWDHGLRTASGAVGGSTLPPGGCFVDADDDSDADGND